MQVESLVTEVLGQMLQEVSSEEFKAEERIALEKYRLEQARSVRRRSSPSSAVFNCGTFKNILFLVSFVRIQQEHKTLLSELSVSLCTEILNEVTDDFVNQTSTAEIQYVGFFLNPQDQCCSCGII